MYIQVTRESCLKAGSDTAGLGLELEMLPLQLSPRSAQAAGLWATLRGEKRERKSRALATGPASSAGMPAPVTSLLRATDPSSPK